MSREGVVVQKKYLVTISKIFEYPSCVVNEKYLIRDLSAKVLQDLAEMGQQLDLSYFDVSIDSKVPYIPSNKWEPEDREALARKMPIMNVEFIIKQFVQTDAEAKFGSLDPRKNPSIYEKIEENVYEEDDDGNEEVIDVISQWIFGPELAAYWNERFSYYLDIIRKIKYL